MRCRSALLTLSTLFVVGCGMPVSPTNYQDVSGTWSPTLSETTPTTSHVPECRDPFLAAINNPGPQSLTISQTLGTLTATAVTTAFGQRCNFTGSMTAPDFGHLTADASCRAMRIPVMCGASAREMSFALSTIYVRWVDGTLKGSVDETWQVLEPGTTLTAYGTMNVWSRVSATR